MIDNVDKSEVLNWMSQHASGFRNARTRKEILPNMQFKRQFDNEESKDRYFRAICSQLKKERHIASTSSRGFWFVPLVTDDPLEIEAVLESCNEMYSRAMDMLEDCSKNIKYWQDKKQGQQVMELVR